VDDGTRQLELVGWLREYLTSGRHGPIEVTHSTDTVVLPDPDEIEGRWPDLVGKAGDKVIIGLARMGADVDTKQSVEDYNFFGTYRETGAAFILAVPRGCEADAEAALSRAGLDTEQFQLVSIGNFAD
jgi:hypothetical protein